MSHEAPTSLLAEEEITAVAGVEAAIGAAAVGVGTEEEEDGKR
jgi:hypothetical protein